MVIQVIIGLREVSFRTFLLTLTVLKHFLLIWQQRKKTFIWRDGDLEDFLLSSRENNSEILRIFKPDAKFTTAEDKEKYNKMKTTIKKSLKNGCFRENLDALADIVTHFPETERLFFFFLKDI